MEISGLIVRKNTVKDQILFSFHPTKRKRRHYDRNMEWIENINKEI